jgi:hypothetical protein
MLAIKNANSFKLPNANNDIEAWHCNLFDYGTIYAILLTHDKTLFSFFIYGLEKDDFKYFTEIIQQNVFKTMLNLGFEQKKFEIILESMENMRFSKTDDKSVLASMNQLMPHIYTLMDRETELLDIIQSVNDMVNQKLNYNTPREKFEKLLGEYI